MTITLPIAAHITAILEWLRSGVVRLGPAQVELPRPTLERQSDRVLLRWEGAPTIAGAFGPAEISVTAEPLVEFRRDRCHSRLWGLLSLGRIVGVAPKTDMVIPDLLGFDAVPTSDGGAELTWPRGMKPWIDTPLPDFVDPVILRVRLGPKAGQVIVRRGPDVELVYA